MRETFSMMKFCIFLLISVVITKKSNIITNIESPCHFNIFVAYICSRESSDHFRRNTTNQIMLHLNRRMTLVLTVQSNTILQMFALIQDSYKIIFDLKLSICVIRISIILNLQVCPPYDSMNNKIMEFKDLNFY